MPKLSSRKTVLLKRNIRPSTDKIIFIACEGQATEEDYFTIISNLFDGIKSKIQFISVMEEIINTPQHERTTEQIKELGKNNPIQLVEKIDKYKQIKNTLYEFDKHPEDEFWIIADVDHHTDSNNIENWNKALEICENKNYGYAISNPFFEVWLLLHHLDPNEEDYKYAVTDTHKYEKTEHFKFRLKKDANAALIDNKHIDNKHYNIEKIKCAVQRAETLHNKNEKWPHNLGSTVYILINKIIKIADNTK